MSSTTSALKLQLANSALKEEVRALKSEVRKLQSQKAKLQAKNVSLEAENKTQALTIKNCKSEQSKNSEPYDPADVARRLRFLFATITHAEYKIIGPDGQPVSD